YGMGEKTILEAAQWVKNGCPQEALAKMRGICYMSKTPPAYAHEIPSHRLISQDRKAYCEAFMAQYDQQDPIRGKALCQQQDTLRYLVQNPPAMPLNRKELDAVYGLPYQRRWHPSYDRMGGVPALAEVKFSIAATRGCFGACHFCALTFHQGRIVQSRSEDSIVKEAIRLTQDRDFKGYIHDVGGPTANFLAPACKKQLQSGACKNRQCLVPTPCKNMEVSHGELVRVLRRLRALPKVKKVFIRSGLRYDYLIADKDPTFLKELCEHHISGQLKVAPEHVSPRVLEKMGKPKREVYDRFVSKYQQMNERLGLKQYLVPYLMSSHPGSDLNAAVELALYLRDTGHQPEQVQDFYPTPGTLSTCMFYTGLDPRTMEKVFVPRSPQEKAMQRALLQYRSPANHALVRKALRLCGREDLIGHSKGCLVPPGSSGKKPAPKPQAAPGKKAPIKKRSDKWAKAKPKKR
ncbi:MAG: YgiQ family radical SAM protein, partial [Clostridia bacterium]|nr:YgiQ family radical SAM protein [Clostridia bacterium]